MSEYHIWVAGRHVFQVEVQSNEQGYSGATFKALSGKAALTAAEKTEFVHGLLGGISRLAIPDRICLPLLKHPDVRRLMP